MKEDKTETQLESLLTVDENRRRLLKLTSGALAAGLVAPLSAATFKPVEDKVAALSEKIKGTVIARNNPNYEPWRVSMAWNNREFGRYPDMIVQAESEKDVIATVKFAKKHGMQIKSRSGGHSWSGCFLRNTGILLDLSRLQAIKVNKKAKTVSIGAGVIGRVLNTHLGEYDLAFPTAHCGMVPLSGFLMGGGVGVNFHAWGGMSTFSILDMDVVTPDGKLRHVSKTENPELFWAARGAGPGLFFTVVRFTLQCYPLPGFIRTDFYMLPYDELINTVAMTDEVGPKMGKAIEMLTIVVPTPAEDGDDSERVKGNFEQSTVLSVTAFAFSQEEADALLEPIRSHPQVQKATFKQLDRPSTLEDLYMDNEVPFPQTRARVDNIFTNDVVEATKVLSKHMPDSPTSGNSPVVLYMGDLEMDPDTAIYSAKGRFYLAGYAQWASEEYDIPNQNWVKTMYDEMQPFASGYYINEYNREARSTEINRCFRSEDWEKLKKLRKKHDPHNVYHGFLEV